MTSTGELDKTIIEAQKGDEKALARLAELSAERLYGYVFRLTLNEDMSKDIVQESVLQMLKILKELKKTERFWPWLYGLALNNTRRHQRQQKRHDRIAKAYLNNKPARDTSIEQMITEDIRQIVTLSISKLKTRHRAVLAMRCYEQMSFEQISESLGCSKVAARMVFARAKRALAKQLSRHGLGKGAILMTLMMFGKMTAPSQAAASTISVTSASLKVAAPFKIAAALTSKTAIITIAATGIVTSTAVFQQIDNNKTNIGNSTKNDISINTYTTTDDSLVNEFWYYFPDDPGGAVMIRTSPSIKKCQSRYQWLLNAQDNFRYDTRKNIVEKVNHKIFNEDISVWQLPTDSPSFTQYIAGMQNRKITSKYAPVAGGGWLIMINSGEDGRQYLSTRHCNVLDEEYFRYNWPKGVKIIDRRDQMHKRGWTYFSVTGQIDNQHVKGNGRIPFVYATSQTYWPWMKLNVGGKRFVDTGFNGFARPWIGLHSIDIIRRDTAGKKLQFSTRLSADKTEVEITVLSGEEKLIYIVDLENDLIERIELRGQKQGILNFEYLQDIDNVSREFTSPKIRRNNGKTILLELLELTNKQ